MKTLLYINENQTLSSRGFRISSTVVLSRNVIGRTQEILMLLDAHGIQAYVDGMCRDVYKNLKKVS